MNPSLTIRRATPQDIPALAAFARETFTRTFGHLYTPENLRQHMEEKCSEAVFLEYLDDPAYTILLGFAGNELAAYIKGGRLALPVEHPVTPAQEVHRLYVSHRHQGQGFGKAMLERLLAEPPFAQAKGLYIGVWSENLRAQALYQSFGFSKIGEYLYRVGDQADHELILGRMQP